MTLLYLKKGVKNAIWKESILLAKVQFSILANFSLIKGCIGCLTNLFHHKIKQRYLMVRNFKQVLIPPGTPLFYVFFFKILFQVWLYLNLFPLEETDSQVAHVTTDSEVIAGCPADIPPLLQICTLINPGRVFPQRLKNHAKFNDPQVDQKRDAKTATCIL